MKCRFTSPFSLLLNQPSYDETQQTAPYPAKGSAPYPEQSAPYPPQEGAPYPQQGGAPYPQQGGAPYPQQGPPGAQGVPNLGYGAPPPAAYHPPTQTSESKNETKMA